MIAYMAVPVVFITMYMIIKNYQTHTTLTISGLLMLTIGVVFTQGGIAEFMGAQYKFTTTGSTFFDLFGAFSAIMSERTATIGMIAMTSAGFAAYMSKIGAADSLVKACAKPLQIINKPYLILAMAFIIGQTLNLVIPSPAGLAMLLLISFYPILIQAGVSPLSAAVVIGTCGSLDLGPGSGNSNVAAELLDMSITEYFATTEILVAIPVTLTVAVSHFFVQKWFDKRDGHKNQQRVDNITGEEKGISIPKFYAVLPFLPLALLMIFSDIGIDGIKINAPIAMFTSLILIVAIDACKKRNLQLALEHSFEFFKGMAGAFSTVVVLIVAATMFTLGLDAIGAITALKSMILAGDIHYILITIFGMSIIAFTAMLTGSGSAAFVSFASLGNELSSAAGVKAVQMLVPMQHAAGFGRSLSPVAAVVIAVAVAAKVSPFEVLKRAAIPCVVGIFSTLFYTQLIFA
ncbi:anaerobic C4-dicarboxylate transporter [Buttiauxella ferragutiae ATCC 51602]|uniref:Anaerobic C4-dicarboxylate transporter n=1 Tax=Buttiauxella ferragutiae ATCC 51602 TaxID=1354252 RepID=A0ABX2W3W5_9ENTR|nr:MULTISPECIES: C4-dicarboxylate transporter DcuC [Buttiauxella]AYN26770.1 hypothetical protein D8682_07090 [Buttiauxella sp. 3AFRM03]MCE0826167.1 C4-dicarboxylate transporter DcuC [Buttiauxella ferragutiae]OAT25337.1 anaerobic C4-dicarboxylate transporter [Buttiauxella ferragutiae ATCC 51602]TDN52304.1 DcuC family C4-dicarboxylate transporter [Buttiauxella sp. JUb87]